MKQIGKVYRLKESFNSDLVSDLEVAAGLAVNLKKLWGFRLEKTTGSKETLYFGQRNLNGSSEEEQVEIRKNGNVIYLGNTLDRYFKSYIDSRK